MKLKKVILLSLLFSFFVVLTPRSIWHSCEHTTHTSSSKSDDLNFSISSDNHCFACDYHLGFIDTPELFISYLSKKSTSNNSVSVFSEPNLDSFHTFSKRGPPSI